MNITKWFFVAIGMVALLFGLNVQAYGIVASRYGVLDFATYFYVFGAFLLIVPPCIEYYVVTNPHDKDFSKLLIVLQIFLVVSGLLFFWKGDLVGKIVVRVGASLLVTAYLKYGLKQLPDFRWQFFFNPIRFLAYHWDCFRGKYGPAYPLSLGIDWLGVGYAFLAYPFGKGALLLGSAYLLISAWRGYRNTRAAIPMAWSCVNLTYVLYGSFFFVHALVYG